MRQARTSGSRTILLAILLVAVLLRVGLVSAASSGKAAYDTGQKAYASGKYSAAVADYESAIRAGYHTPAVYYKLGLSFSHLNLWNEAVWAYDMVNSVDPAYASSHPVVTKNLAKAKAKGGVDQGPPADLSGSGASVVPAAPSGSGQTSRPQAAAIVAALTSNAVYVDPSVQAKLGDSSVLAATAHDLQSASGTALKVAFLSAPPSPYTSLGSYTYDLFQKLGLKKAVLIVVDPNRINVSAQTDRLSTNETQTLVDASRPGFLQGSIPAAVDSLARSINQKADDSASSSAKSKAIVLLLIVLIVAIVVALFVWSRLRGWRRGYNEAVAWRDSLAGQLTETGNHVDALLEDNPAKQTFLKAAAYYSTASSILDRLAKVGGMETLFGGQHRNALGEARTNLQAAERGLGEAEALASGKSIPSNTSGVAGGEILPDAQFRDQASGKAVPAACFFCSKPLNPATAQTVTIPFGDGTRRVMACDEHAADVKVGRQPAIRTVPNPAQGGQAAPWWSVPSYDPRRDYVYDPYYSRGGGGIGWGDLLLFDALFNRPQQTVIFADDNRIDYGDDRGFGNAGAFSYGNDRPDSASFEAAGRDGPSAAEADFGTGGDYYGTSSGDRS